MLNTNGARSAARTVKLLRNSAAPLMRMGTTTEKFFQVGELHEATQWKHAHLPPDDLPVVDPDAQFDSFDKIPKKRSVSVTIAAIVGCLVIGSAAWAMAFGVMRTGRSVGFWVSALMGSKQVAAAPVRKATLAAATPQAAPAEREGAPQTAPSGIERSPDTTLGSASDLPGTSVEPIAPTSPTTPPIIAGVITPAASARAPGEIGGGGIGGKRPATAKGSSSTVRASAVALARRAASQRDVAAAFPSAHEALSSVTPDSTSSAVDRDPAASASTRDPGGAPLRGYVWSPSAKSLVPAGTTASEPDVTTRESRRGVSEAPAVDRPPGDRPLPLGDRLEIAPPSDNGAAPAEQPAPVLGGPAAPTGAPRGALEPPAFTPPAVTP